MPPKNHRKTHRAIAPIVLDSDPPIVTDPSNLRRAKLDDLHAAYLQNPPSAREERQAEQAYLKALEAKQKLEPEMERRLKEQTAIGEAREAMKKRHAEEKERMRVEMVTLNQEARELNELILELAKARSVAARGLDLAAERVVQTHGRGPFELDGVTYDVGCYDERVYLVKRHVPEKSGKGPRAPSAPRGEAARGKQVRRGKR